MVGWPKTIAFLFNFTSGDMLAYFTFFQSENTTSLFCQMIARLSELSQAAVPTPFHQMLRALDDRGKLLRVYTQNIDAIELKCGLSFGVPEFEGKRCKPRSKGKSSIPVAAPCLTIPQPPTPVQRLSNRLPSPPAETPRCIPLHGTLQTLHCQTCTHSFPLEDHLPSLISGTPPQCPECTAMEETRQLIGKRARGVGKLRPSVVLYNETHKDGEGVGEVVRKDLIGSSKGKGRSGADLLLVVGTSLRVPGTKRIVREFAKAVHSRGSAASSKETNTSSLPSPSPSPRRSPTTDEEPPVKAVYLNLDFPVPTREWEGVFDAWIQGDAQMFAKSLQEEIGKEMRAKELASGKKKKREEEAALAAQRIREADEQANTNQDRSGKKRKGGPEASVIVAKRQKIPVSPTPVKNKSKTAHLIEPYSARQWETNQSKLILRIPARPGGKLLVPEVYITTPASSTHIRNLSFAKDQLPPTPATSPPRRAHRRNVLLATNAGRKAARASRDKPASANVIARPTRPPAEEGDGGLTDRLTASFVRTIQYGLRGSGG
jgi:NAD-dependent SIR2 family protein deacetylase